MKNSKINFVCIAGFGYSGSGAVVDILIEFEKYYVFPKEFRLIKDPDGIIDLDNALIQNWQELSCDVAISRFIDLVNICARKQRIFSGVGYNYDGIFNKSFINLCNNYVNSLVDIKWKGDWPYHLHQFNSMKLFIYRLKRKLSLKPELNDIMYFSSPGERFYKLTKNLMDQLFANIVNNNKYNTVVLDQAIPPYNPQRQLKYFHNVKVIVVDRDPRDIYLELINYSSYPTNSVDDFIKYYKTQREAISQNNMSNSILRLNFEDLVFNYDKEMEKIYSFLQFNPIYHSKKLTFFLPKKSHNNVGCWKEKNSSEIKLIEKELNKFLYLEQ